MKSFKPVLVAVAAFAFIACGLCVQASAGTLVPPTCGGFSNACGSSIPGGQ